MASVDTMEESEDTDTDELTGAQIADDVDLAAALNTNYITVDVNWNYPEYMLRWVDAVRAAGERVWFRIHPNAWQGDYGTAATMTPAEYLTAERAFIEANPSLFEAGDILDMNPEPENSPYWVDTYGQNWTKDVAATNAFNQFFVAVSSTARATLQNLGITGVITTVRSTNSWFAENPSALYPSTVSYMGRVTIDSYPDQNTTDPAKAVRARLAEIDAIQSVRPNTAIVMGEFGYSNAINVNNTTQQRVVNAELRALTPDDCIQGLNYWLGAGTQGPGGYTRLFAGSTGEWRLRPAATDLSGYFANRLEALPGKRDLAWPASPKRLQQAAPNTLRGATAGTPTPA